MLAQLVLLVVLFLRQGKPSVNGARPGSSTTKLGAPSVPIALLASSLFLAQFSVTSVELESTGQILAHLLASCAVQAKLSCKQANNRASLALLAILLSLTASCLVLPAQLGSSTTPQACLNASLVPPVLPRTMQVSLAAKLALQAIINLPLDRPTALPAKQASSPALQGNLVVPYAVQVQLHRSRVAIVASTARLVFLLQIRVQFSVTNVMLGGSAKSVVRVSVSIARLEKFSRALEKRSALCAPEEATPTEKGVYTVPVAPKVDLRIRLACPSAYPALQGSLLRLRGCSSV
mmetsp:Transcript_49564/g.97170  ORF Transcript_49564/g.97170 Transcript_49564/m.97170 type:complete len:292 (+) Transcript_49564:1743-2618(+)